MIKNVYSSRCSSCHIEKTVASVMWRQQNIAAGAAISPTLATEQLPLCSGCTEWVAATVAKAHQKNGNLQRTIVAGPVKLAGLADVHHCYFCRSPLRGGGSAIGIHDLSDEVDAPIVTMGLCQSCDQWLISLAIDSRSARQMSRRQSEGEYGSLLHPRLAHIRAGFAFEDSSVEQSVRAICERIGVTTAPADVETTSDVLFMQTSGAPADTRAVKKSSATTKLIVLARVEATTGLRDAMAAGAADWMTLPFTPQQVVGALHRVTATRSRAVEWDWETLLPRVHDFETTRPIIEVVPNRGVDPLVVAWSLRRLTRGYDHLLMADGHLLLVPLARPAHIWLIIERLTVVMGERAMLLPYEAAQSTRFEASA